MGEGPQRVVVCWDSGGAVCLMLIPSHCGNRTIILIPGAGKVNNPRETVGYAKDSPKSLRGSARLSRAETAELVLGGVLAGQNNTRCHRVYFPAMDSSLERKIVRKCRSSRHRRYSRTSVSLPEATARRKLWTRNDGEDFRASISSSASPSADNSARCFSICCCST